MTIGSIFSTKNEPTQVYQQHFSGEVVDLFIAIGSICIHKNGPTQVYWQYFLAPRMGLCMCISSIFLHQGWAYTSVSAAFLRRSSGPIHCHQQYFYP